MLLTLFLYGIVAMIADLYAQRAPQATDGRPKFLLLRIKTANASEPVVRDARFEDCNGHHRKLLILFSS